MMPRNKSVNLPSKIYEEVYYVDRINTGRMFNPVAIRPMTHGDRITWDDTSRGTALKLMDIKLLADADAQPSDPPKTILIVTAEGDQLALRKLNLDLYNAKVKNCVAGSPEFDTEAKVREFYLTGEFTA